MRETLAVQRRVLGEEHPNNLKSASNLSGLLIRRGKPADAEHVLRDAIACMVRVLGEVLGSIGAGRLAAGLVELAVDGPARLVWLTST